LTAATLLALAQTAHAHGIAGNRYFDGTLGFDDPAVADEAILPLYSQLSFPTHGSNVGDNRINWAFARLLTRTLAFTADGGWVHQNWPIGHTSGADKADKFDSPRGQYTAATMNPGFAYVAVAWQIAAEVIIPLNRAGGTGTAFRAQLLFFLDDLIPSVFGKPLLSSQPERSQIAW